MEHQPMIIEGYDNESIYFSNINTDDNLNTNNNFSNLVYNLGEYISHDLNKNEEPFLKELLDKYDKNLDDLFLKVNSNNIDEIVNKYIKKNKKIDIDYKNSFNIHTEKLKNEFKLKFNITDDIKNIKKLFLENNEEMLNLENELEELLETYNKNKNTILKVQDTYKNEKDKELLTNFESIFDNLNNNYIERNDIENKLKKYIDLGIKNNIFFKIINDVKSLIHTNNVCSICIHNQINRVLIPCGHTFCDKCVKKNENRYNNRNNYRRISCPICRKEIINTNNIYII